MCGRRPGPKDKAPWPNAFKPRSGWVKTWTKPLTFGSLALEENNTGSWRGSLWLQTSTGQLPNLFFQSFSPCFSRTFRESGVR